MSDHDSSVPPEDDINDLKAGDAKEIHRAVREEGEAELERPASSLMWSGVAAGFAITASLVTEGRIHAALPESEWRPLVVALGYPVGFAIVILGRMQFFTESTITATLPLVTHPSRYAVWRTLRLWALVLLANLTGTAIAAAVVGGTAMTDPTVTEGMLSVSRQILAHGWWATFMGAIPAGFLVASIAWVLPNAREHAFFVIFAITYVVGVAGFSHSVLGSSEAFTLMWHGDVGIGQALFGLIAPAVLGNLAGGAGLFALLAHGQVRGEMVEGGSER